MKLWRLLALMFVAGLLVEAAYAIFPIPRAGAQGVYTWGNMIWCTSHSSCMHEVGHMLDDRAGWISHSPKYIYAVELYMIVETANGSDGNWNPDRSKPFGVFAIFYHRSNPDYRLLQELYASMFGQADGQEQNMPEVFRPYYNWRLAPQLIRQYVP